MERSVNRFSYKTIDIAWYTIGEGKPLLMLHGWGSSASVMMPLAKQLAKTRQCFLVDLPGFGNSPEPPAEWGISDYAAMTRAFVDSYFPDDTPDLLVHSFGCRIMLKILSIPDTRDLFDKIIVTGGAGLKPVRSWKFYIRSAIAKLLKAPVKLLPSSMRDRALQWIRGTALWRSLGSSDYQQLSGVMRGTFVKSVNEHFDDQLHHIDKEILLLWGKNDGATPVSQAKRLEKGLKNSALVEIENAGHYAFLDQPATFVRIAKAYLDG